MPTPEQLVIEPAAEALSAARAFAKRQEASGRAAHVMESLHDRLGIAMVHLDGTGDDVPDVVLVHPSLDGLRHAVATFQLSMVRPANYLLACPEGAPLDVQALFQDRMRSLTQALTELRLLAVRLDGSPPAAEAVVRVFREVMDIELDLDGGIDALGAVDATVDTLRAFGHDEQWPGDEAVYPVLALYGLGLVGTEIVRRLGDVQTLGELVDTTFTPAQKLSNPTLAGVHGFPAVQFTSGQVLAIARKTLERFRSGSAVGMQELWTRGSEAFEAKAAELDRALAILSSQIALEVRGLHEDGHVSPMPSMFSLKNGKVQIKRLVCEDSDAAERMYDSVLAQESTLPACCLVFDAYYWDRSANVRYDAIMGIAGAHGERLLQLSLPYTLVGGEAKFPVGVQLLEPLFDYRYTRARVKRSMCNLVDMEVSDRFRLEPPSDAVGDAAHGVKLLIQLAGLAPFAVFLWVAQKAGEGSLDEQYTRAEEQISESSHPVIQGLIGCLDLSLSERFKLLTEHEDLPGRSIAAAGVYLSDHPGAAEDRAAVFSFGRALAGVNGHPNVQEAASLERVVEYFDKGEAYALAGSDPFQGQDQGEGLEAFNNVGEIVGLGPLACFLVVASADGDFDPREGKVFIQELAGASSPVLQRVMMAHGMPLEDRFNLLTANPALLEQSITVMSALFMAVPGGTEAKNELLKILEKVAAADGDFDESERKVIDGLARILDGRPPNPQGGVGFGYWLFGGLGAVVVLFALWMFQG